MIELILSTLLFLSQETTVEADAQAEGWRVSGQIFLDESFSTSFILVSSKPLIILKVRSDDPSSLIKSSSASPI